MRHGVPRGARLQGSSAGALGGLGCEEFFEGQRFRHGAGGGLPPVGQEERCPLTHGRLCTLDAATGPSQLPEASKDEKPKVAAGRSGCGPSEVQRALDVPNTESSISITARGSSF